MYLINIVQDLRYGCYFVVLKIINTQLIICIQRRQFLIFFKALMQFYFYLMEKKIVVNNRITYRQFVYLDFKIKFLVFIQNSLFETYKYDFSLYQIKRRFFNEIYTIRKSFAFVCIEKVQYIPISLCNCVIRSSNVSKKKTVDTVIFDHLDLDSFVNVMVM